MANYLFIVIFSTIIISKAIPQDGESNNRSFSKRKMVVSFNSTSLWLSFEEKRRVLVLLAYSPEQILHYGEENKAAIFCFTNAASDVVKKQLKVKMIFHYEQNSLRIQPFSVYRINLEKFMGMYWCEALDYHAKIITSNEVIGYQLRRGNEYALRIVVKHVCKIYSCDIAKIVKGIKKKQLEKIFEEFKAEIRVMQIFGFDTIDDKIDILYHVSTTRDQYILNEYDAINANLKNISRNIELIYFRSSEYCMPDTITLQETSLSWSLTNISVTTISDEFCAIDKKSVPLTRTCEGNFLYGATWSNSSKLTSRCLKDVKISRLAQILKGTLGHQLSNNDIDEILNAIKTKQNYTVIEAYYITKFVQQIYRSKVSNPVLYIFDIIDNILESDENVLALSQSLMNITDEILDVIDDVLSRENFNLDQVYIVRKRNFIIHVMNPFYTNIKGLLLYGDNATPFPGLILTNFKSSDNISDIVTNNLQLATFLPDTLLEQFSNESDNSIDTIFMKTVIFSNDRLFFDSELSPASRIVSVSITGSETYLKEPIPVIIRAENILNSDKICGYWGNRRRGNRKKGKWSHLGGNYLGIINSSSLHVCSYVHLTHFALLIMNELNEIGEDDTDTVSTDLTESQGFVFEIITNIGAAFSVIGIIGIFLTGIKFKQWRSKTGTKILMHLSIAILLEIICVHLSKLRMLRLSHLCIIVGMILHYVVLTKFCWMLVFAYLQYFRFVRVIGAIPNNLILKSATFSWGFPLFLVFVVSLTADQQFETTSYPKGLFYTSS